MITAALAFLCGCVFGACGLATVLHHAYKNVIVAKIVHWITHCQCPLPGSASGSSSPPSSPTH